MRPVLEDRIAWVLSGEVVLEVIASVESLRAEATLVGFLPGVVAHVPVAVGFGREAGAAVLAQVAAVLARAVLLQVGVAAERLAAVLRRAVQRQAVAEQHLGGDHLLHAGRAAAVAGGGGAGRGAAAAAHAQVRGQVGAQLRRLRTPSGHVKTVAGHAQAVAGHAHVVTGHAQVVTGRARAVTVAGGV